MKGRTSYSTSSNTLKVQMNHIVGDDLCKPTHLNFDQVSANRSSYSVTTGPSSGCRGWISRNRIPRLVRTSLARWGRAGVTKATNGYRDRTDFKDCSSVNAPGRYDSLVNSVTYAPFLDIFCRKISGLSSTRVVNGCATYRLWIRCVPIL